MAGGEDSGGRRKREDARRKAPENAKKGEDAREEKEEECDDGKGETERREVARASGRLVGKNRAPWGNS